MREIQASSRNFCANEERARIKCVKNIIQDLEFYGPAGLMHIIILSNIIGKSISIWNYDGSLNRIVGKEKKGHPIDVEYHSTDSGDTQIGHWTLRHGKDPDNISIDLNSCLISVIGSQIGQDPSKLRKQLILKLRHSLQEVDEIIRLEGKNVITLMIGGASYKGETPSRAAIILDTSQNAKCHGFRTLGYPRGHASDPDATGDYDSVENYARTSRSEKPGFLSRTDQNVVAHWALSSPQAIDAMEKLNRSEVTVSEYIIAETLQKVGNQTSLPKAKVFDKNGNPATEEREIAQVVLVMRHHENKRHNAQADVFVQTFYPVLK